MNKHSLRMRREAGFTLVELMVGVLVGLIATIVMFQVFAVSEGQKRTTTGAGDAQQNGVFSLFQIERDARMSGYGLNYMPLLGCQTNGWYESGNVPFVLTMAPVVITNGAGGAPDAIAFMYGNTDTFLAPSKLTQTMPSPTSDFKVDNRFGFSPGDVLVAAEAGKPCTLTQVRVLPNAPGTLDLITHDSGNYTDQDGVQRKTEYNRIGGLPPPNNVTYTAWNPGAKTGGRLYLLGSLPVASTYSIVNNQLVQGNGMVPGDQAALSDGIVQLQAQYGFDGNGDGNINPAAQSVGTLNTGSANDQWGDAMPVGAVSADWAKVVAVRLAVVARSMTPERPNPVTNVCDATTANPIWLSKNPLSGGTPIDVTANPDWQCFRYRIFEVTVPLRNITWFPVAS